MSILTRRTFLASGLGGAVLVACRRAAAPADARAPAVCEPTADNIEGPFFLAGAPSRAVLVGDDDPGQRLALGGVVRGAGCAPLAGATLEIWHADHRGAYDEDGYRFRGRLRSDADGAWDVATIVPGRYLNGRRYRPAHLHVKLSAPGHRPLTTQLYFAGDPYLVGDPFVEPSLIMPLARDGDAIRCAFDFVLEPA